MIRRRRAFTLFEVLVSIAIFMLLAGGIFAAVQASFSASREVVTSQLASERLDAFQQFLRRLFVSLPSDARIQLSLQNATAGDIVELRVWPVPAFLQFGANSSDGAAISARPDGRGGFRMMLAYFRADDTPDERDEQLADAEWLPLLPDVKQLRWRFAPTRNPVFEEAWSEQSGRPGLVELALGMKDGGEFTFQYWVPPLQRRSSGAPEVSSGDAEQDKTPQDKEPQSDKPKGGEGPQAEGGE